MEAACLRLPWFMFLLLPACTSDPGVTVHNADPRAEITSHADGDSPDAGLRGFTGTVEDPDHDAEELTLSWLVDGAEACPPVSPDASGNTSCEIFLDSGERTVTLQVEDPLGGLASDKVTLDVQPYGDPWAEISAPLAGGVYYSDKLIELAGVVGDEADAPGDLEAWWESSLDADLEVHLEPDSSGNVVGSEYLSEGEHQLLLKVRNTGGNEAYDSVTVTVGPSNSAPSCDIVTPKTGSEGELGEQITLAAEVSDPDVPSDWLSASWSSNLDGLLDEQTPSSSGTVAVLIDSLSVGGHTLTLTVEDEVGASCTDFVLYTVRDCPDLWYQDADGDGYGDAAVSTTGCEAPSGFVAVTGTDSTDCDDGDAAVNPGATEVCDSLDNDCDGDIDDADSSLDATSASTWYADVDGDGYGDASAGTLACSQPSGTVADSSDCDDSDAAINPGASEVCNGSDDDCDGDVDDADASLDSSTASSWYSDADGDGYGDATAGSLACSQPTGTVADATDCDDSEASTHPGADEYCDGHDDDCDGDVDEDSAVDANSWYADADGDGYGDPLDTVHACAAPSGYIADDSDCDDGAASVHPGADEYCDGVDTDCDGDIDEDTALDASTWYADADADGYGDPLSTARACASPSGFVTDATDCDDSEASTNPGADEYCDGHDDDCDGGIDEDRAVDATTWSLDADGDGFGGTLYDLVACSQPTGFVSDDSDCNDGDADVFPGAAETCNGSDDDCDGDVDEDDAVDASAWYADADTDGYGDASTSTTACSAPTGTVADATDCDDGQADINPGADEYCNSLDDDCDGEVDEDDALDAVTWYADADGDGYGDPDSTTPACSQPSGYLSDSTDCDDGDATVNPGASETWYDGVDADCDGSSDYDADGDGYDSDAYGGTDCDDTDDAFNPGVAEVWYDGVDQDCDGWSDYDADMDGVDYGTDCDDTDASAYPGATELCLDGVDNDCDGEIDICAPSGADAEFTGVAEGDKVSNLLVADIDDDGFEDIIMTSRFYDGAGENAGATFVVLGGTSVSSTSLALADLVFDGEAEGDNVSGLGAGDFDGDGVSDLLVGADDHDTAAGEVGAAYLIYGSTTLSSGSLSTADVKFSGVSGNTGHALDGVGDVDGDGFDDLMIGSTDANLCYLVYGGPGLTSMSLSAADAQFEGENSGDLTGHVAGEGDVDGDGYSDLLIGSHNNGGGGSKSGAAYLVYGGPGLVTMNLSSADVKFNGEAAHDHIATGVELVDADGDGLGDPFIMAYGEDSVGVDAGAAYLIYGQPGLASMVLSGADVKFLGEAAGDGASSAIGSAGDVDGDGTEDLLIGAPGSDLTGADAGAVYFLFGGTAWGTSISLSDADALVYGEAAGDQLCDVAGGDVNGDGFSDVVMSAAYNDDGATDAGAVYLFLSRM